MSRPRAPPTAPVLDEASLAALIDAASSDDDPAFAAATRRVRHRVLARVVESLRAQHLTVRPADGGWHPLWPGVTLKPLHERDGVLSYLLRMAPGAQLPAHRHPIDEECIVLAGAVRLGSLELRAGGYHLGREGIAHASITSPGGALLFLRGAAPDPGDLIPAT